MIDLDKYERVLITEYIQGHESLVNTKGGINNVYDADLVLIKTHILNEFRVIKDRYSSHVNQIIFVPYNILAKLLLRKAA